MSQLFFPEFIVASIIMGLGIGLDAALATMLQAKKLSCSKVAALWLIGITLTHTLFPMLGYSASYFSMQILPQLTPFVGALAFILIAIYLFQEFQAYCDDSCESDANHQYLINVGLILAVSWDALWSGPAKSAQVVDWPELAVWLSFIFVGAVVAFLTIGALLLSRHVFFSEDREIPPFTQAAISWLQYTVVGYFGWLALIRYTLSLPIHDVVIFSFSALITALMLAALNQRLAPRSHTA